MGIAADIVEDLLGSGEHANHFGNSWHLSDPPRPSFWSAHLPSTAIAQVQSFNAHSAAACWYAVRG